MNDALTPHEGPVEASGGEPSRQTTTSDPAALAEYQRQASEALLDLARRPIEELRKDPNQPRIVSHLGPQIIVLAPHNHCCLGTTPPPDPDP